MIRPFYERWADAVLGLVNTAAKLRRFDDKVHAAEADFIAICQDSKTQGEDILYAIQKFRQIGAQAKQYNVDAKLYVWPALLLHEQSPSDVHKQSPSDVHKLSNLAENSPNFRKSVLERGLISIMARSHLPAVPMVLETLGWTQLDEKRRDEVLSKVIDSGVVRSTADAKNLAFISEVAQSSNNPELQQRIVMVAFERLQQKLPIHQDKNLLPLTPEQNHSLVKKILLASPVIENADAHISKLIPPTAKGAEGFARLLIQAFKTSIAYIPNKEDMADSDASAPAKLIVELATKNGVELIESNKDMLDYLQKASPAVRAAIDADLRGPQSPVVAANVDGSMDIPTLQGIVATDKAFEKISCRALKYVLDAHLYVGYSEAPNVDLSVGFPGLGPVNKEDLELFFAAPQNRRDEWFQDLQASILMRSGSLDKFSQVMTAVAARYNLIMSNGQSASEVAAVQVPPAIAPAAPSAPAQIENGDGGNATPAVVTKPTIRLVRLPDGTMGLPQRERAQ